MSRTYRQHWDYRSICQDGKQGFMTTPGWWNTVMHQRPFRQKNRVLSRQLINGYYDLEDIEYPKDHKKPHIYFW